MGLTEPAWGIGHSWSDVQVLNVDLGQLAGHEHLVLAGREVVDGEVAERVHSDRADQAFVAPQADHDLLVVPPQDQADEGFTAGRLFAVLDFDNDLRVASLIGLWAALLTAPSGQGGSLRRLAEQAA